jgi:hypothetical protein
MQCPESMMLRCDAYCCRCGPATTWSYIAEVKRDMARRTQRPKGGTDDESFDDHTGYGLGVVEHVRNGAEWRQFL